MRNFIFYYEWLEYIKKLPEQDQSDLLKIIVEYGCQGEYSTENSMMSAVFEGLIQPQIDRAQKKYVERVEDGKKYGREKKVSDDVIFNLAASGKKAKEIAQLLEVSVDTVYHSEGWKKRKGMEDWKEYSF